MVAFSDMLTYLRKQRNLSQQEFADQVGLTRSAVSMYETGRREPDFETLEMIADFFNVNMATLLGKPADAPRAGASAIPLIRVPRVGTIACGTPILAEENIEEYDQVPEWTHCNFTLVCKGDSMIGARIYDGDLVCIRSQPDVENGEIAAVLIDDEATLKRVRKYPDHIVLEAENPNYRPFTYWDEDMNRVRILGKATHFISEVR